MIRLVFVLISIRVGHTAQRDTHNCLNHKRQDNEKPCMRASETTPLVCVTNVGATSQPVSQSVSDKSTIDLKSQRVVK